MSAVKDYLYKNLSELSATQHNIMQVTFLVIQGSHGYDEKESFSSAVRIFDTLFNAHLTETMEVCYYFCDALVIAFGHILAIFYLVNVIFYTDENGSFSTTERCC